MRASVRIKTFFLAAALLGAAVSSITEGPVLARAARKPARLIAMTLATAEMLLALAPRGKIVGLHKLAGNAGYSNVADAIGDIPLIGSVPERIISLRPDMVFVASYSSAEFLNHLRAAGVPVARFSSFTGVEDVFTNIEKMGRLNRRTRESAKRLITGAREKIRAIRAPHPQKPETPAHPDPRAGRLGDGIPYPRTTRSFAWRAVRTWPPNAESGERAGYRRSESSPGIPTSSWWA